MDYVELLYQLWSFVVLVNMLCWVKCVERCNRLVPHPTSRPFFVAILRFSTKKKTIYRITAHSQWVAARLACNPKWPPAHVCTRSDDVIKHPLLCNLAKTCNFGNEKENNLRDQLVYGCHDDSLREKLFREETLTLQTARQTSTAHEAARQNMNLL